MNNDILVKVEGVSKKFCRDLKRSLFYGVKDISSELFGSKKNGQLRKDEFWAVEDVSFELKRGECLGLIGHNGAGKSTLLKMLNGLIKPDKGKITMHGRIGALIELGAGFNPILTGRENIYNNGAVLGFSKKEIDAKYDAILDFAEIDEFIDMPVQNYSSGMKVRLGFAVASQMEPDVLLIDEVLAVGDLGFRAKCFNRINELQNKSAVIFVSHAMNQVSRLCTSLIHMDHGHIGYQGTDLSMGIEQFFNKFGSEKFKIIGKRDEVELLNISINNDVDAFQKEIKLKQFETIELDIKFKPKELKQKFGIQFSIFDRELKGVAIIAAENNNVIYYTKDRTGHVNVKFENYLAPGMYSLNVHISTLNIQNNKKINCSFMHAATLNVTGSKLHTFIPVHFDAKWSGTCENLNKSILNAK